MKKRILVLALGGVLAAGLLAGCGAQETPEEVTAEPSAVEEVSAEPEVEEVSAEPEMEYEIIGEESEDAYQVLVTNSTGQDITGIAIMDTVSGEYGDNMLAEDDAFAADETRVLYCEPVTADEADAEDAEEATDAEDDEKLLAVGYNVEITLADETTYVLHNFPMEEMEMGEIFIDEENEVAYLEYNDGVSTLESELAEKELEEETPAASTGNTTTSDNGGSYTAPAATESSAPAASAPAPAPAPATAPAPAPSQSTESCVGTGGVYQGADQCVVDADTW